MIKLTQCPEWKNLQTHQQEISQIHMRELFSRHPERFKQFSLEAADLFLDYSKNRIAEKTVKLFIQLAEAINLPDQIKKLFSGQNINSTENQPALHTALRNRSNVPVLVNGHDIMPSIKNTLEKMAAFVKKIHTNTWQDLQTPITDIVNIGIGGSDLGPYLATEALSVYKVTSMRFHFVSNIDSSNIANTLKNLNPNSTLFIVSSKSFSTQETLVNTQTAKEWFKQQGGQNINKHFMAVTCNINKAKSLGFLEENIFPIWEWVGGRYSLWSAIGLPIALAIGIDNFHNLLAGAHAMDQHFQTAPLAENMPFILGMLSVWNINFFDARAHAILPYDHYLQRLPNYLQQAEMESNGKHVRTDGTPVDYQTGAVIFGSTGTNGQHAIHQLLHQGTQLIPADFIVPINNHHPTGQHHPILFANALSQSKALLEGKTEEEAFQELIANGYSETAAKQLAPHKVLKGNQSSNTILYKKLTPNVLGALIALYEHKIFVESAFWGINAFDQWGVELGKKLADKILTTLNNPDLTTQYDSSTNGLIEIYRSKLNSK